VGCRDGAVVSTLASHQCGPGSIPRSGACFSKVPKLFGRISGEIILFVSSKRRRLEARNFASILTFSPFTTYEKTGFPELAFRARKVFRTFEKRAPGVMCGMSLLVCLSILHREVFSGYSGFPSPQKSAFVLIVNFRVQCLPISAPALERLDT